MGRRAPFNIKLMIQVLQFYVHNNLSPWKPSKGGRAWLST